MTKVFLNCFNPEASYLLDHAKPSQEKSSDKKVGFISKMFATIFQKQTKPAALKTSQAINDKFLMKFCNSSSSLFLSDEEASLPTTPSILPAQRNFSETPSGARLISPAFSNTSLVRSKTGVTPEESPKEPPSPLAQSLIEISRLLPGHIVSDTKIADSVSGSSSEAQEKSTLHYQISTAFLNKNLLVEESNEGHTYIFEMEIGPEESQK